MNLPRPPLLLTPVLLAALMGPGSAQVPPSGDGVRRASPHSVTRPANTDYLAGGVWRAIWGTDYREAWATPVTVPVLDLRSFAGGLTPLRRGGGLQTLSLRFAGEDGREYSFRGIDKDPTAVLPDELKESLAADVVKDQISAQHPYGALVADSLLGAVGVLHANPRLFVMPDDPMLGEFREDFAGMLGFMEVRPDENQGDLAAFYGADRVIGTERLFERIAEHAADRVDRVAYLQARLVDFVLGDWDRHRDQWRWAQFGGGGWQPIPRDRDQALSRLDGLLPGNARFFVPQLVGFSETYTSVVSLSWSGREMDRRFLAGADRRLFDSLALDIQRSITDHAIDGAVGQLPPEVEPLHGDMLRGALRARRDSLGSAAAQYYALLAREVDLHASDDDEVLHLTMDRGGRVHLRLATADQPNRPYEERTFSPAETTELRVRLHGGDDLVVVDGGSRLPFTVRVVTGGGDDAVRMETDTRGLVIYDDGGELTLEGKTSGLDVRSRAYDEWEWSEEDPAPRRDWGSVILAAGAFGYGSDYGLLLGAGASKTRFGFRRDPHRTFVKGVVSASTSGKLEARLELDFRFESKPTHLFFTAGGTQFDVLHFYGVGNDVAVTEPEGFYDADQGRAGLELGIATTVGNTLELSLAQHSLYNRTGDNEGRFISTIPDLYGAGGLWQLGARGGGSWRSPGYQEGVRGSSARLFGSVYPALADVTSPFGGVDGEWRGYLALARERISVLAFRLGGRKIWGDFPWYEAAFLGGDNLRGLPSQRYAGDASVYGSAEVRLQLGTARFLVPQLIGLLALADVGRVWFEGESPGNWHSGVGVGLWLGLINSKNILSASYARSEGGGRISLDLGFPF